MYYDVLKEYILFCGKKWWGARPEAALLRVIFNDMEMVSYWLGELFFFRWVRGHNWDDNSGTSVEKGVTGVEESFGDVVSDDF